jgi:hypothetical protein
MESERTPALTFYEHQQTIAQAIVVWASDVARRQNEPFETVLPQAVHLIAQGEYAIGKDEEGVVRIVKQKRINDAPHL